MRRHAARPRARDDRTMTTRRRPTACRSVRPLAPRCRARRGGAPPPASRPPRARTSDAAHTTIPLSGAARPDLYIRPLLSGVKRRVEATRSLHAANHDERRRAAPRVPRAARRRRRAPRRRRRRARRRATRHAGYAGTARIRRRARKASSMSSVERSGVTESAEGDVGRCRGPRGRERQSARGGGVAGVER